MKYFQERFEDTVIGEMKLLVFDHIAEVGPFQFEFDVDWDKFVELQESDSIRLFVARSEGNMVGYAIYIISTHTHFATTVFALQDALYIAPQFRGNGAGIGLIRFCEEMLVDCDAIVQAVSPELDFSDLLTNNGYVPLEKLYVKKLSEIT